MSFYASQFNNKSTRYCSSNLYGSNLSTVYADGPPPLDDTLEEDDGEIVFRDKNPKKDSPKSKLDNDKSGTLSGESDFNPWSNNDQKDEADDHFGGFTGFADFSSAFGGNSKSQNDSPWFKNGDNDQSSVTNFNHSFPSHQGEISSSSRKTTENNEGGTSRDDDFGCFSGEDSDFDDFHSFTSSNRNVNSGKSEENGSKDSHVSEDSGNKKTTNSDELFKNDKAIHGGTEQSNHSLKQNSRKSNCDSVDDFDEFSSFEGGYALNGSSMSPTNDSSTSHSQKVTSNICSTMKPTCFSDDDDDFGDFSSSSFDDDNRGETTKSPDLIVKPQQQHTGNEFQSTHMNKSSSIQSSKGKESEHDSKESNDSDETVQLSQYNGPEASIKENEKDFNTFDNDNEDSNTDQSKQNINDDDGFGEFSVSGLSVTKTGESNSKQLSCDNNIDDDDDDFGKFGVESPPSLSSFHDDDDEFGAVMPHDKENAKKDDDDDDFGKFGVESPPSLSSFHDDDDDDDDEFGAVTPHDKENAKKDDDDDDFGKFGVESPQSLSSFHDDDDEFGAVTPHDKENAKKDDDDDDFGEFGQVSPPSLPSPHGNSDDDEFGDFGTAFPPQKSGIQDNRDVRFGDSGGAALEGKPKSYDDEEFGDFDSDPATNKPDFQDNKAVAASNDDAFGKFGYAPTTTKQEHHDSTSAAGDDDDDDDFGDFGSAPATSKAHIPNNNDDADDFGDFGVASPTIKQNKDDDFGDFAEVEQQSSKENKSISISKPSSLEPKGLISNNNDEDDEFGQFDSAPSKPSDFSDFKSSDNTCEGFADFSSMPQKPLPSSFNAASGSQLFLSNDSQHGQPKVTGCTCVVKPQRSTNPDILAYAIKECFTKKDVTIESHIIIQKIEHEVKPERSSTWQQLLISEKNGSLRFDWVLSEHQVKMLEGLSMVPVKIQTSVSFKPKGQAPAPLFASSMSLLEPVKGVITPFHHVEEINPSQDPFGAPPEVGLQDLGFGKASKKETIVLPIEAKDNASDTISVSSSLDLDFLAPSTTNGESTKTESRGLFEDDLLGLGMFSESSPSPKITNGKNMFKFNNTTIPLATSEGNLSEQAKTVIKDFEDLSFMLSRVLMFPLKSKE